MSDRAGNRTKRLWYPTAAIALLLAALTAWWLAPRPIAVSAILLPTPRPIAPELNLQRAAGPQPAAELFADRISYVFFGFTHCPDVCPITLQQMAAVLANLPGTAPQMVFVSVDPERDDPARVQAYADYFDSRIVGVTASPENLQTLATALGVAFHIEYHEPGVPYGVDHSTGIYIVDGQQRYRGLYRAPHDVDLLSREFESMHRKLTSDLRP